MINKVKKCGSVQVFDEILGVKTLVFDVDDTSLSGIATHCRKYLRLSVSRLSP